MCTLMKGRFNHLIEPLVSLIQFRCYSLLTNLPSPPHHSVLRLYIQNNWCNNAHSMQLIMQQQKIEVNVKERWEKKERNWYMEQRRNKAFANKSREKKNEREEIWEITINRIRDELINVKIVHCNNTKACWSVYENKALKINSHGFSNENRDTCSDSHTPQHTLEAFTLNRIFPTFERYCFLILSPVYLFISN